MPKKIFLTLFLIVLLASALRLFRFTTVPPNLYWDEASISYNAYSINETGKDEWGEPYPVLFKSFGDYKLPAYIYAVALSQRFFGLTDAAVRIPSILAGILTVLVAYFLVREQMFLVRQKFPRLAWARKVSQISLLASFLMAISPWHLQFSRAGFEANLALMFLAFAMFFFLYAVRKNIWLLSISFLSFVACFYTYHSAAITTPLKVLILALLFRKTLLKNYKVVLVCAVLAGLALLPYLPNYVFSAHGRVRFNSESVFHMPGNPVVNFTNNYVSNFSPDFLFFIGDQNGRHSVKKMGELYLWQLVPIVIGLVALLKYRSKTSIIILSWLLIAAIPPSATTVSPHALRDLMAVRGWQVLTAIGSVIILLKFPKFLRLLFIPLVLYSLAVYLNLYYIFMPHAYAADWQDGTRKAVEYLRRNEYKYDHIYVHTDLPDVYLLLYLPYPPKALHKAGHNTTRLGKFIYTNFRKFPVKKNPADRDLVLAPKWMVGDDVEIVREIRMVNNDPVYRLYEL